MVFGLLIKDVLNRNNIRTARRATSRRKWDRCQTVCTILCVRRRWRFVFQSVDGFDQQKNYKGDDQKTNDVVDERAIGDYWESLCLSVGQRRRMLAREIDEEIGKVGFTQ